jgi:hypothetical protein
MTTEELIKRVDEKIHQADHVGYSEHVRECEDDLIKALRSLRTAVVALKKIENFESPGQVTISKEALDEIKKGWAE